MKIQGYDFSSYLDDIQLKLVRTYKGEIVRTLTGKVAAFPTSFITVGFDLSFLGPRKILNLLQQVLLSADLIQLETDYNGTSLKGNFSCTKNNLVELRDKGERNMALSISLVSDGSDIKKPSGQGYNVTSVGGGPAILSDLSYGKIATLPNDDYFIYGEQKIDIPSKQILILGDVVVDN